MVETEILIQIIIYSCIFGIPLLIYLFHKIWPWLEDHSPIIFGIIFLSILGTALGYILENLFRRI